MKKSLFILFILILSKNIFGQYNQNMYDFTGSTYALRYNPGMKLDKDIRWYMNLPIPILNGFNLDVTSTSLNAYKIFNKNKTISQTIKDFSRSITKDDFIGGNLKVPFINFGFRWYDKERKRKWFFTFDLDFNAYGYAFYPESLIGVLSEGIKKDKAVDLSDLAGEGSIYTSYSFGVNHKKDDSPITFGAKLKFYNSIATVNFDNNSIIQTASNSKGNVGLYVNSDTYLRTSGLNTKKDTTVGNILKKVFFSGNFGLGIDLGLTYEIDNNWTMTASVIDLGFINHSNDAKIINYKYDTKYEGDISETNSLDSIEGDIKDSFKNGDTIVSSFDSYIPTQFNLGFKYTLFGKSKRTILENEDCERCDKKKTATFTPKQHFGVQIHTLLKRWRPYSAISFIYHNQMFKRSRI